MIEAHAAAITRAVRPAAEAREVRYEGIDFSMAPHPDQVRSLGSAIENVGVPKVGLAGSVAAAVFLTDCINEAQFKRTGYCGLIFPVLEDSILAARAAEEVLTISDLLLFATVCGAGLDAIPLPGDASIEALGALLIDVGALALRHNKPLAARLLPIPDKVPGDDVFLSLPSTTHGRVMDLPAEPLTGLLGGTGILDVRRQPSV